MFPFRRVCTLQSSAGLIWGVILLLFPEFLVGLLGAETDATGLVLGRFAGGMLFALGGVLFALRDSTDLALRRRVALANAVCDAALVPVFAYSFWVGTTSGFVGGMVIFFFTLNTVSWLGTTADLTQGEAMDSASEGSGA